MIETVVAWAAAIVFIEATVEIEVASEIFRGFRSRVVRVPLIGWYLNGLFSCGYCLSVWVSAIAALFVPGSLLSVCDSAVACKIFGGVWPILVADYLFKVFVLHRLSNIWHEMVWRWLGRMPFVLGLRPIEFESEENETMELDADEQQRNADSRHDNQ